MSIWHSNSAFIVSELIDGRIYIQLNAQTDNALYILNRIDRIADDYGFQFSKSWYGWVLTAEQASWFLLQWGGLTEKQLRDQLHKQC
jgi:hypothetical protein